LNVIEISILFARCHLDGSAVDRVAAVTSDVAEVAVSEQSEVTAFSPASSPTANDTTVF